MTPPSSLEILRNEAPAYDHAASHTAASDLNTLKVEVKLLKIQGVRDKESVTSAELVSTLIGSLEFADKDAANRTEEILVRLGQQAADQLLLGLKSAHSRVKSVCAMSLIRIGQPIVPDLCAFYISTPNRSKLRWIVEFILNELGGQQLPSLDGEMAAGNVIPFLKTAV